jgi:hypothetical protein
MPTTSRFENLTASLKIIQIYILVSELIVGSGASKIKGKYENNVSGI